MKRHSHTHLKIWNIRARLKVVRWIYIYFFSTVTNAHFWIPKEFLTRLYGSHFSRLTRYPGSQNRHQTQGIEYRIPLLRPQFTHQTHITGYKIRHREPHITHLTHFDGSLIPRLTHMSGSFVFVVFVVYFCCKQKQQKRTTYPQSRQQNEEFDI